jgi:lysophospholipase L1-like esterase
MDMNKKHMGKTFAILGDSYSTFEGWIPEGNEVYYPNPEKVADVLSVEQTWWHRLLTRLEMKLLLNDSFSGSTVCTQVREKHTRSACYVERANHSFAEIPGQPDYIFLFGGTNDNWLERVHGKVKFGRWNEEDFKQAIPAYCYVLSRLKKNYPNAQIISIINTDLHPDICKGWVLAAEHYGAKTVALADIQKQNGHPTALGMAQIADQVEAALLDK